MSFPADVARADSLQFPAYQEKFDDQGGAVIYGRRPRDFDKKMAGRDYTADIN